MINNKKKEFLHRAVNCNKYGFSDKELRESNHTGLVS
jgi:hypothetical protein